MYTVRSLLAVLCTFDLVIFCLFFFLVFYFQIKSLIISFLFSTEKIFPSLNLRSPLSVLQDQTCNWSGVKRHVKFRWDGSIFDATCNGVSIYDQHNWYTILYTQNVIPVHGVICTCVCVWVKTRRGCVYSPSRSPPPVVITGFLCDCYAPKASGKVQQTSRRRPERYLCINSNSFLVIVGVFVHYIFPAVVLLLPSFFYASSRHLSQRSCVTSFWWNCSCAGHGTQNRRPGCPLL